MRHPFVSFDSKDFHIHSLLFGSAKNQSTNKNESEQTQKSNKEIEDVRLNAVKEAYWLNSSLDDCEFYPIYDSLAEHLNIENPSHEQAKLVFMMFPETLVGSGIQWSFSDSEVRSEIHDFVESNKLKIINTFKQAI